MHGGIRTPRLTKPQLGFTFDGGSSLSQGLKLFALLNEYATGGPLLTVASPVAKIQNLLGRNHGSGAGIIGPSFPQQNWTISQQGPAFVNNSTGTSGAIDFGPLSNFGTFPQITFAVMAAVDQTHTTVARTFICSNGSTGSFGIDSKQGSTQWETFVLCLSGNVVANGTPSHNANGRFCDLVVVTYDGTTLKCYVNGLLSVSTVGSSATNFDSTAHVLLSGWLGSANQNHTAPITMAGLWNRVLTYAEIQKLYLDPYWAAVYKPRIYKPQSTGGGSGGGGGPIPPISNNRFGVNVFLPPQPANAIPYRLCVNNNRLHCVLPDFNGIFSDFVYYLGRENNQGGYWYRYVIDPSALFSEEDGMLFSGFGDGGVGNLFVLDPPNVTQFAGTNINIDVVFPFSKNDINTRKDVYHLRFHIDTGGSPLNLTGYTEFTNQFNLGTISANGIQELNLLIQNTQFNLARRMTLQLNGTVNYFKLLDWSIDYDNRPEPLSFLRIATNYQLAAKKRLRTIPIVIDTRGQPVGIQVIADGVNLGTQSFTTNERTTVFYYMSTDVFATDLIINITAATGNVFEYYDAPAPVNVETLPVGKLFDQIGPVELERIGALLEFRIRMLATTNSITYNVYMDDTLVVSPLTAGYVPLTVTPNIDKTYGPIKVPKGIQGSVCRIEFLSSSGVFYRWNCKLKFTTGGTKSDTKQVTIQDPQVGRQN